MKAKKKRKKMKNLPKLLKVKRAKMITNQRKVQKLEKEIAT